VPPSFHVSHNTLWCLSQSVPHHVTARDPPLSFICMNSHPRPPEFRTEKGNIPEGMNSKETDLFVWATPLYLIACVRVAYRYKGLGIKLYPFKRYWWRRCITLWIIGLLDFVHRSEFWMAKNTTLRNWNCFIYQARWRKGKHQSSDWRREVQTQFLSVDLKGICHFDDPGLGGKRIFSHTWSDS
jgi:hypothetical protein